MSLRVCHWDYADNYQHIIDSNIVQIYLYIFGSLKICKYEVIHIYTYFISAGGDPINGEKGNLKSGKQRSASTRSPKHQGQEKGGEARRRSLQPEISWNKWNNFWNENILVCY